jgi:multisubunit Na+/H+ antiporter MnhG subunit
MQLKGKPLSLGSKVLAALIVLLALVAKALWGYDIVDDAIKAAAFIAILFSPVDASLIAEAVRGWKYMPQATVEKKIGFTQGEGA